MIDILMSPYAINLLGRLGENEHRRMLFPIAEYTEMYPGAAYALIYHPPGASEGYPVATTSHDERYLYWIVTNTDLAAEGSGLCELIVLVDSVVAKSDIYKTKVLYALDGAGTPPPPWEGWQAEFARIKGEAEDAAEAAEDSATAALESAQTATDASGAAVSARDAAQGYASDADGHARDAAGSATAAQESAEAIQDMSVESETIPPGSPLNVEKTIDPETGAVTLMFYLAPGQDGVSPTIAVEEITGGHRVTVIDAQGTRSFDVMNGTNGDDGRGIASATMNADYTLTLTYTDGTSYTTPSLRGAPGADGYSPVASVSKSGKVATISITDRQGTTTATVSDGEDGTPGVSPTITVTDITGGHRVTITDATGAHSFDVMDGDAADVPVQDVQVNGVSVLSNGVANIDDLVPISAFADKRGVIYESRTGYVQIRGANENDIKVGVSYWLIPSAENAYSVAFYGLAKAAGADMRYVSGATVGVYPEAQKSAISQMLNGSVSVEGTTPSITALPGIRYVCGEVATLDITLPASGIVDVVFTSGATATVLTVTPVGGVTVKWANGFDPTALDVNTTYEINIADGLGVAASWT